MTAYATSADLIARFDVRLVGDLASDDGTQVASGSMAADERITAALDDASGEIDSSVMIAGRYSATDLAALTGTSLAHLKRMTCDIAFFLLIDRRCLVGITGEEADRREKKYMNHLKELREGRAIFNVEEVKNAGRIDYDGPTTQQYNDMNYLSSRLRGHSLPNRLLPNNR